MPINFMFAKELERVKGPQGVFEALRTLSASGIEVDSEEEEQHEEDVQREMDSRQLADSDSDSGSDIDIVKELRDGGEDQMDSKITPEVNEKLRDYELQRLRYYFAVIVCESIEIAKYVLHFVSLLFFCKTK